MYVVSNKEGGVRFVTLRGFSISFFFLFICFYSQFVQFGHLIEFYNNYINMLVGVPSSRLLGYILCEVSWVFPF